MSDRYDVVVVGARCAGSPTAMLLARMGHRVLVVDRATFPSDTVSTHVIHAPGVAALQRWGLLERITATGCPPMDAYSFDFGAFRIRGSARPVEGVSAAYAPRRTVLDKTLVDAAADAGAEVREGYTVDELVFEDGTVTGIRGRDGNGRSTVERATFVIGADGRHSRVARAARAEQYHEKPVLQFGFYTYWSGLPVDGFETFVRPGRGWAAIPTNDDLSLVVVGWPYAEAGAIKRDVEANYRKTFDFAPEFAERVRAATRVERFTGGAVENFFRRPYGPGWVLVGDAGYDRDPITAQGISDAFRDAEWCAAALDRVLRAEEPFDEAMAAFHRARDLHVSPMYEFTTQLATLEPPPPEMQALLHAVSTDQPAMDGFASVVAGTMSPVEFFDPLNIEAIMRGGAAAIPT